jgi:hypothetical protein
MMLSKLQRKFSVNINKLFTWILAQGYEFTIKECLRTPEQQAIYVKEGKSLTSHSMHLQGLAMDIILFIDGEFITDSAKYKPLGDYWVSLDPNNRWGGDFNKDNIIDKGFCDYDHFELQNK